MNKTAGKNITSAFTFTFMDAAKNSTLKSSILATGLSYLVKANLSCPHAEGSPNHLLSFSSPLQMLEDLFLMCLRNLKDIKMFRLAGWVTYIFAKPNSLRQNVILSVSGFELGPFFQTSARHISSVRLVGGDER